MPQVDYIKNLTKKQFHKLIVGAALKDFKAIEDFSYYFTHAQADVIDISAFPHSVISAQVGIKKALAQNSALREPLVMVSVNVDQDPHFRRIELNKEACTSCLACIPVCPSGAFGINETNSFSYNIDLCFACSNCLPVCKDDALSYQNWNSFESASLKELKALGASAIEIHLSDNLGNFKDFYQSIPKLFKLESFCIGSQSSNPQKLFDAVDTILECVYNKFPSQHPFIIQIDGVPISGARENKDLDQYSIDKAKLVIDYISAEYSEIKDNIFIQLAGGTNSNTLKKALAQNVFVNGVAIGSYARKRINEMRSLDEILAFSSSLIYKNNSLKNSLSINLPNK